MVLHPFFRLLTPRTIAATGDRRVAILVCWAVAVLVSQTPVSAQQRITVSPPFETTGTVKTVSAGTVTVTDSTGKDTEFKIQPKGEPGVPLSGIQGVIGFPAQVQIRGVLTLESLTQGTLVRFTGKLNRVGRTEGAVDQVAIIDEKSQPYFRDVFDHVIRVIETLDSYRDLINGMLEIYLSSVSNRMNEVMKVLTVFATIFIPLTFLVGIYGMNFDYMPELRWKWSYPILWLLFFLIPAGLLLWFRKRKWL